MKRPNRPGFTLIELMLVVAIIGLLAAIAIPKFANLVVKAREASVKGKLGSIRSAVGLYYASNEGIYPGPSSLTLLQSTLVPNYLDEIPNISIPTAPAHRNGNYTTGTVVFDWLTCGSAVTFCTFSYSVSTGRVVVACTHTDSNGTTWSLW